MADQDLVLRTEDSPAENEHGGTFPAILVRAGKAACFAADEFFSARISNPHTRTAYAHQVSRFLAWCEDQGLELHQVTPGLAGRFLDELPGAAPTQNQALAGLRHFFDTLVARHAAVLNPFQSVRGVRHPHGEGRTPEVTVDQARQLLASIKTRDVYGLRDRAVLGTLIYTGARVGAISPAPDAGLCATTATTGRCSSRKKEGRSREIPVRHDLDEWISAYLEGAGLEDAPQASPLYRAGQRRGSPLTDRAMSPLAVQLMLKRRLRAAGLPKILSPHSFRVLVVTDLLSQNVPLEDVQYLAGHAHPRTTQIYDRRRRRVSRNLVERISV